MRSRRKRAENASSELVVDDRKQYYKDWLRIRAQLDDGVAPECIEGHWRTGYRRSLFQTYGANLMKILHHRHGLATGARSNQDAYVRALKRGSDVDGLEQFVGQLIDGNDGAVIVQKVDAEPYDRIGNWGRAMIDWSGLMSLLPKMEERRIGIYKPSSLLHNADGLTAVSYMDVSPLPRTRWSAPRMALEIGSASFLLTGMERDDPYAPLVCSNYQRAYTEAFGTQHLHVLHSSWQEYGVGSIPKR